MRARGAAAGDNLFTADTIAEQFGVVRSSYVGVALPARDVLAITCRYSIHPGWRMAKLSPEIV
jgi:hypothetical protein